MTKENSLAPTKSPNLGFITQPGKGGNEILPAKTGNQEYAGKIELPKNPVIPYASTSAEIPGKGGNPVNAANQVDFNIPMTPANAARLYSEVFHDIDKRPLYLILNEIIEAGLKDRPYRGPASEEWLARQRMKGRRKKS